VWIDDRGSEVLPVSECRRLLALGAKRHLHGHLGVTAEGGPLVLPLDYRADGSDLVFQIGEHLFDRVNEQVIGFQVDSSSLEESGDGTGTEGRWSVLVRGLASELTDPPANLEPPHPQVAEPGHRLVRLRGDIVTGRRLRPPATPDRGAP